MKRSHRLVVLPDYQGIGIGWRLQEFVGDLLSSEGFRYCATTSNPALIAHRQKSNKWRLTGYGRKVPNVGIKALNATVSSKRLTTSWEYKNANTKQ